ncbi:MAG: Release factor glutamine methyltransferase [candidate division CPR1 bacterium GW2011_GWA2_42_17]|uniref:Release factor glutamine methyltransferase n=1 Tax=candidate division CPR1 bacterium GW2011_GWA2_42_17 TaxID=1618341 RepID=A0A0G1BCQ9_9BACT|nr:MAG: Release factor glutamine methyltransferase [candidate division CPR1 bacterium GW2011_GWA2_42_17]
MLTAMPQQKRVFTPYEQNQLKKYKVSLAKTQKYGTMPVEYICGFAEFGDYDFAVNPNVLIPRVESIQIVEAAIDHCSANLKRQYLIADVGCGSGNIGISLFLKLQKRPITSQIYLSDLSGKALKIAQQNAKRLIPKAQLANFTFLKSNLLSQYPKHPSPRRSPAKAGQPPQFDLIVANLPYIPTSRLKSLPASVKNYEPLMALDGGPKGLQLIKALIRQAPNYLKENGAMILEIDDKHKLTDFTEFINFKKQIQKDCFSRNRFLLLQRLF